MYNYRLGIAYVQQLYAAVPRRVIIVSIDVTHDDAGEDISEELIVSYSMPSNRRNASNMIVSLSWAVAPRLVMTEEMHPCLNSFGTPDAKKSQKMPRSAISKELVLQFSGLAVVERE